MAGAPHLCDGGRPQRGSGFVRSAPMDFLDWVAIVGASTGLALVLLALWQLWLMIGNERRRIQPIVIAHETQSRRFSSGGSGWSFKAYLQNSGQGSAFNVRFGVEVEGIRWPYRMRDEDPASGNRQRVVEASRRLPEKATSRSRFQALSSWAQPISASQRAAQTRTSMRAGSIGVATRTRLARPGRRGTPVIAPMIWIFAESAGSAAMRSGRLKSATRQRRLVRNSTMPHTRKCSGGSRQGRARPAPASGEPSGSRLDQSRRLGAVDG